MYYCRTFPTYSSQIQRVCLHISLYLLFLYLPNNSTFILEDKSKSTASIFGCYMIHSIKTNINVIYIVMNHHTGLNVFAIEEKKQN
jgi:cytochrome b561